PGPASHRRFEAARAHRTRRHPAVGRAQRLDLAAPPLEPKGGDDGRDVLIETFANLVGRKIPTRSEQGNADCGDDFTRRKRGLAIAGNARLDRQHTLARARSERHRGVERDQARNGVADRRGGGEIAGNRSEIANLPRADAAYEATE